MIVVISIAILIFGVMFYFLNPKKIRVNNLGSILINRSTIAFLITAIIVGISYLYVFYWSDSLPRSNFKELLDMILSLPMVIVFIAGYSAGGGSAFLAIAAEVIVLTLIIRLLIPKRWPAIIIERFKIRQR